MTVSYVGTIDDLKNFSGSDSTVIVTDANRGGIFNYLPAVIDNATIAATRSSSDPLIISTTVTTNALKVNDLVVFTGSGLPAAITVNVPYFVSSTNLSSTSFKISASLNGPVVCGYVVNDTPVSFKQLFVNYTTNLPAPVFNNSDKISLPNPGLSAGDVVTFDGTGSFTNILTGVPYFVVSATPRYFQISTTATEAAISTNYTPPSTGTNIITLTKYFFNDNGTTFDARYKNNGWWVRTIDKAISVKWFGAIGDGVNDDSIAINRAIAFAATRASGLGAKVWVPAGVYGLNAPIIQRNGVQIEGEVGQQVQAANSTQMQKMAQFIALASMNYMFTNEINGLRTNQSGLESGKAKSYVNSNITNIFFNGNNYVQWCIYWFECWNGTFTNLRISNALSYGLVIFDGNQQIINNCSVIGVLLDSVADGVFNSNNFIGTDDCPGISLRGSNFNTMYGNLMFFGLANDSQYIKKISSWQQITEGSKVYTKFIVDDNYVNELGVDPGWHANITTTSDTATSENFLWDSTNKKITCKFINTGSATSNRMINSNLVSNDGLIKGNTYRIKGNVRLLQNSDSASTSIKFAPTNTSLTPYLTVNVVRATDDSSTDTSKNGWTNIDNNFDFMYDYSNTGPFNILIQVAAGSTDFWEFSDIKVVFDGEPVNKSKDPYLFIADKEANDKGTLPSQLVSANGCSLGSTYFIKFWNSSSFSLANSRSNFTKAVWMNVGPSFTLMVDDKIYISPPQGVLTLTDSTCSNTISNNKIEDVQSNAIALRSAYGNVFSGNTIMKARLKDGVKLIRLEAGSMDNQFTGNTIYRRLVTSTDKTEQCVYIDKVSYRNHFSGNRIGGARDIDIRDNYVGTAENANRFDSQSLDNTLIFQNKSTGYTPKNKGLTVAVGSTKYKTTLPVINYSEFTLFFKDVVFNDSMQSVLFTQDDYTNHSNNAIFIVKNNNNQLQCYVGNTSSNAASLTSPLVLNIGQAYDIAFVKDGMNNITFYIDGVVSGIAASSVVPPNTSTSYSYIGNSGDQIGAFSIGKFRYYSDSLIQNEISTLSVDNARFDRMKWASSNIAIDGNFTLTTQKTFTSLGNYTRNAGGANSGGEIVMSRRALLGLDQVLSNVAVGDTIQGYDKGGNKTGQGVVKLVTSLVYVLPDVGSAPFNTGDTVTVKGIRNGADTTILTAKITSLSNASAFTQQGSLDRVSTYRLSVWAKTGDTTLLSHMSISRDGNNYNEVHKLTAAYQKIVAYLPPVWLSQTNLLSATSLRLKGVYEDTSGSETVYTNAYLADMYITGFRLDKNGPPLEVLFDFSAGDTATVFLNEKPALLNSIMNLSSSSGGPTNTFLAGEVVQGQTSNATAVVLNGGGNAFVIDTGSITGTFDVGSTDPSNTRPPENVKGLTSTRIGAFVSITKASVNQITITKNS